MGLFNWTKKKGSDAKDYAKKVVGTEDIKKNSAYIAEMAKIINPANIGKDSKKETFVDAKKRLNVTDLDIIKNYKNMAYGFYVSIFFVIVCFIGTIYYLFVGQKILPALNMLVVLAISLANAFRFSFRSFQIKHQKLCSVKEWWNRAGEWFPKLPK